MLFSAHSKSDMKRDISWLEERFGKIGSGRGLEWVVKAMENPFKSGGRTLSQIDDRMEISIANEMVYGLRLVA